MMHSPLQRRRAFGMAWRPLQGILMGAIYDNITINIGVGYGEYNNGPLFPNQNISLGGDSGFSITYSNLRALLASHETSLADITSVNALPNTTTLNGQSSFVIGTAEARALGALAANSGTVDGHVGMGTNFTGSVLIGGALHELTHAMGRVPGASGLSLFRYTSQGNHLFAGGTPAAASYFSIDGGVTKLADFGVSSDPSDFLNSPASNLTPNDPFDEGIAGSTLTSVDRTMMDVLGFNVTSSPPPPATSDLIPENIALGSSSVVAGGSLSVNWDILNQGTAAANATSTTEVRITSSPTSAAGTNLVGLSTLALGAGASQSENTTLTVPTTPGTYYVWVIADNFTNVTNQSNTSNDLQHSAAFTVTASPPPPPAPPASDGTALMAGGGILTTADGVWSFGAAAAGGFSILLNGQSAAGGSASNLEVAQNGHLFADNAFGNWYEWNGSGWTPSASPGVSSDGTVLLAADGSALTTADGVWSFGAVGPGGFSILRNGQSASGGSATSLEVAQNGHLFADNAFGNWYEWNGSGWSASAVPPSADRATLAAGDGSALTTADGVWSFGAAAAGGFLILRNGQSAAGGSAVSLEVAQTGHLFADARVGNWYEWSGSGWSPSVIPPSPDGTAVPAGSGGTLSTADGVWGFGR